MALSATLSNHAKYQFGMGAINLDTDSLKICLMATGFTFNKDNHAVWSDVSASELAEANGYLRDTKVLQNTTMVEDDTNDRGEMTCDNVIWTAAGGSIGPSPGAIIYDDTSSDNTILAYLDFGGDQTAIALANFSILNIKIRLP
jgi:hypothetical protein